MQGVHKETTDDLWNAIAPASEALAADNAAIASPHVDSSVVGEVVRYLGTMLDYDPDIYWGTLKAAAKKLLEGCLGDVDGMWDILALRAANDQWRKGVIRRQVKPWFVVEDLIGDYARQVAQERRIEHENTPEGRRERYAGGKYAEYIES